MLNAKKWCEFSFDDGPLFQGYRDGSTWNGFDNVWVTPLERAKIVKWFRHEYPNCPDTESGNLDMLAMEPDRSGLICLGYGYATQVVNG